MNNQSFNVGTLAVRQIVSIPPTQGGTGMVEVGPKFLGDCSTRPTVVAHAATTTLPAAELVNHRILNTGAGALVALTMPTAAAAIAAFATAGITLKSGDTFPLWVCTPVAQTLRLTPSATITNLAGAINFDVTANKSALVTFRVTNAVSGSEAITFSGLLSS
jgi:hypothetical protein